MKLTSGAKILIDKLLNSGYEAYAVGGAVRDFLLGREITDTDITTLASPNEMLEVFSGLKTYPSGLKHGTITVLIGGESIEVTTFREDIGYTDFRRPDNVKFVKSLNEDLKRRDFTMNAIAYNDTLGFIDPYNGLEDIKNKVIRAVGEPNCRFQEDALRILRALRFSSQLDFEIEENTKRAIIENCELLKKVSVERIYGELLKLLIGKGVERVLLEFKQVIFTIIPELKDCDGFLQKSKYHAYDVYTHIVKSVALSCQDKITRLSLLFHDIGKPKCFSLDSDGVGHFYGHQKISAEMTYNILKRFKADNATISEVCKIIELHDSKTELSRYEVKKFLNKHGFDFLTKLINVKKGDSLSHATGYINNRLESLQNMYNTAKDVIDKKECFTLKYLKINGNDLKNAGYKGQEIKNKLDKILNDVMALKLENNREVLLKEIKNDR